MGLRWATNDHLVRVASVYRNAVADGRSPVEAVAADFGITEAAAKKRIDRAKAAGHLRRAPEVFDFTT